MEGFEISTNPTCIVEILVEEALCFCLSYQNGELVRTREENIITSSINFAAVYACTKYSIHFLMPGCRWAYARLIFLSGLGIKNPFSIQLEEGST